MCPSKQKDLSVAAAVVAVFGIFVVGVVVVDK